MTAKHCFRFSFLITYIVIILIFFISFPLQAGINHNYPRLGIFVWGGAPIEWYAKFDLVVTSSNASDFARAIKQINPNIYILPTRDINAGQGTEPYYDEWTVLNSKGEKVTIYGGSRPFADITDYCPSVNGQKYNDAVPIYMSTFADLNIFDGAATDGLWEYPGTWLTTDIDLDRNGVNDWNEHGESWICSVWLSGVNKVLEEWRRMNSDKLFFINSGGFHKFGWETTNGMFLEHSWALMYNWNHWISMYHNWMKKALTPHIMFEDGTAKFRWENGVSPSKDDFQTMRFLLTSTLLGDGYFDFRDIESGEHFYVKYYDEFDTDLGYPTSDAQKIHCEGPGWDEKCIWVRFFDNGVSIVNAKGKSQIVTDDNLRSLTGYSGPYYRFKGGQDPNYNNGELFQEISLFGVFEDQNAGKILGDGIILLRKPKAVVSDIIIDNVDAGTSPASRQAELIGNWSNGSKGESWAMCEADWMGIYGYAYTSAGSGDSYALFRPNIGVAGKYEIYEWHATHGSSQASNVPYEIHHANGVTSGTINQTQNIGKWNSLGTFSFSKGDAQYVKISNKANGYVIADAFKFVYKAIQDSIPPNSPNNLKSSNQTDNSITLTWTPPSTASDGDLASSYEVYRDNSLIGNSTVPNFTDKGLQENSSYFYAVYALDDAGNKSSFAATGNFSTTSDISPPTVTSVKTLSPTLVEIIFSENVDRSSAEHINNYLIDKNINIYSATLVNNLDNVNLVTSTHTMGELYTITFNNIKDKAITPNTITPNTKNSYIGMGQQIKISISADDYYEFYFNGTLLGSDGNWNIAETYSPTLTGSKNVIAVKTIDKDGVGGLIAEIDFDNYHFVSDESWKIATAFNSGWEKASFDDYSWTKATPYGLHGATDPWTSFGDVQGISKTSGVKWIWSSDNLNDNTVYFRFSFNLSDLTPPHPPQGISVKIQ